LSPTLTPPFEPLGARAFRTPTLAPATHTNSYALGQRQVLLVEPATPYEDEQHEWLAWARGLASTGRELVGVFLTHHHADHCGGAAHFAQQLGLPLWAHEQTARRIDAKVTRLLHEGETIDLDGPSRERWQVLLTPGHAPGHLCLWEQDKRALVVGDMVASVGTILIAPGEGHMRTYLTQLERLTSLDARTALPAHGAPIAEPSQLFRTYVAHRLLREAKVLAALGTFDAGIGAGLDELVAVAYQDTPVAIHPSAKLSLQAHLDKLVEDGKAKHTMQGYAAAEVS
jgi:glyoxylase-like metal-dependent hydrolase (beta-lactamase superfamily II)